MLYPASFEYRQPYLSKRSSLTFGGVRYQDSLEESQNSRIINPLP